MINIGDRILLKKIEGSRVIPEIICWWTNSKFSHIEPIIGTDGSSVDAAFPKVIHSNIKKYFNGQYRVVYITPKIPFTPEQQDIWKFKVLKTVGKSYDWLSYIGFITNKPLQDKKKINCSECALVADWEIGVFTEHDGHYISPQSYYDFTIAKYFNIVYDSDNLKRPASIADFNKLLM